MNKYTRVKKKTNVFYGVLLTIIALSWVNITYSQEICNNGIDDDSNGLIDLNDTVACTCRAPASSLIPNASFEEKNCCPSTFSQMNCAQGWVQASAATSDYMNTCGMIFSAATAAGLAPPPDGNGMAGFISSVGYQEYIGSCLTAPLYADSTYLFQLSIASTPITGQGGVCNGGTIFYGPSNIVIYGSQNCSNLPFSGQLCPPAANWQVLDSALYTPVNSWGTISFSFTPTVNINSIIIGSPCTLPASYNSTNGCLPYFYVDNLILNKTNLINTITQTGSWCHSTTVLIGDTISGASYQWYREGVAIVGQTSNILNVSVNNLPVGEYSLSTTVGSICNYTSVEVVAFDNPPQINTVSHYCTYDGEVYLTANITGGIWSGNGITDSINGVFDPHMAQVGANLITYSVTSGPLCPRYDTMSIYVYSPPHPFAGNDTTICSGATIYMGEAPVAGYLYSWTPSTGLGNPTGSLTSLTLTNTDTLPVTAHYSLIVTDAFTGCQGLDQIAIDVNPKPSITSAGPFCNTDAPVNLTASITGGVWSGNAITNATAGTFNPSIAAIGANTVIYNVSGTCAGGDTAIIQVINPPLANAGNDITMCSGTIDSIGAPPILGYTYSWQPASGLSSSTDSKPIVTAVNNSSSPVITNYILTVSSGSCVARDTVKVTVNPQPVLEISNPMAVCSPSTADITAPNVTAGTSGGGSLSYWVDSLATIPVSTPAAIANSGTYYIRSAIGACFDIDSVVVLIKIAPAVDAGSNDTICNGDSLQIGAAAVPGVVYSWSPSTDLSDVAIANPVVYGVNSGFAIQSINYVVMASAGGCSSYDTVTITTNPVAYVDAGEDTTICQGTVVNLHATINGSATTANWSGGTGLFTPSSNSLNASYAPSLNEQNTGSVSLLLTTNDPAGSCVAAIDTLVIAINANAIVNAGIDDSVCGASVVQLNASVSGAAGAGFWSVGQGIYSPNDSSTNAIYTPSVAEVETGIAVLVFTAVDSIASCPAAKDTVLIHIGQAPVANAGSDLFLCEGATISLNGWVGGLAPGATWSGGAGVFLPGNGALNSTYVPAINEFSNDSLVLTLTTDSVIGFSCPISTDQVVIHFYHPPAINFSVDDSTGCPIHCVNFADLSSVAGGSVTQWSWSFGDNTSIDTTQNPSHCYAIPGNYNVTLIAGSDNQCYDTLTSLQFIHIYGPPIANFEYSPNPATLSTSLLTLHNLSSSDVTTCFWSYGDNLYSVNGLIDTVHLYPSDSANTYTTTLIAQNIYGCADTISYQIIIYPEFNFYIPNAFTPNNDGLNEVFMAKGSGIDVFELMVFDRWGNLVFYSDELNKGWDGKVNGGKEISLQDTYVWKVKLTDVFHKKHNYTGIVTLVK